MPFTHFLLLSLFPSPTFLFFLISHVPHPFYSSCTCECGLVLHDQRKEVERRESGRAMCVRMQTMDMRPTVSSQKASPLSASCCPLSRMH
jgi:hypothetical protein